MECNCVTPREFSVNKSKQYEHTVGLDSDHFKAVWWRSLTLTTTTESRLKKRVEYALTLHYYQSIKNPCLRDFEDKTDETDVHIGRQTDKHFVTATGHPTEVEMNGADEYKNSCCNCAHNDKVSFSR